MQQEPEMAPRDLAWQSIATAMAKLERSARNPNLQQLLDQLPQSITRREYLRHGKALINGMAELADNMGYFDEERRSELIARLEAIREDSMDD